MSDVLSNYETTVQKRPTFLTVLCILTFIGSGWGVISGIMSYAGAKKQAEMMGVVKSQLNDLPTSNEPGAKLAEKMFDAMGTSVFTESNLKNVALASLAAAILCLVGAFLMWGLKKTGFYAYVLGTLIGIVVPMILFGFGNIFALGMSMIAGFFGLAFCIMYGLNLKHMK